MQPIARETAAAPKQNANVLSDGATPSIMHVLAKLT